MDVPTSALPVPAALPRARGRADVAVSLRDGAVRLDRLTQSGCARALPPDPCGAQTEAVLVNTSGGVSGGDRIDWCLDAGPGARLTVTTLDAERVHHAAGGVARIETRISAGDGACVDWLPRETVLFAGGRLVRRLEADLSGDARLLALETLVLGPPAPGERGRCGALSDQWRIRRDGRLVHAEALRLAGDLSAAVAGMTGPGRARAIATLVEAAPDAGDRLAAARARLAHLEGIAAGATACDGLLIPRFLAEDLAPLRQALIRFLAAFHPAPLPRVWSA
jgi:urease accessory protein